MIALFHADWSVHLAKRWLATAIRRDGSWTIDSLAPAPDSPALIERIAAASADGPCIAGFDFPVGVPRLYGAQTGLAGYRELLSRIGRGDWETFFTVAEEPRDISVRRPFFPRVAKATTRQHHLTTALQADSMSALLRSCDRKTAFRNAACSLFWTLGANQVGKGALSGWKEIIRPLADCGASLWPFDGALDTLMARGGPVVAETYPGEAYRHCGIRFAPGQSKRRAADRMRFIPGLRAHCDARKIEYAPEVDMLVRAAFGDDALGEDRFDSFVGLLAMIEVAEGRRPAAPELDRDETDWEGWILGQER